MTSTIQNLHQRFAALPSKDQLALTILAIFLSLLVVVYLLLIPANNFAKNAADHHRDRAELLAWMQANEQAARMLASQEIDRPRPPAGQSILSLASQTAQSHSISFKRFEPVGESGLRIWLDNIPFNNMLRWLTQIQQQFGVEIQQASIDRGKSNGLINAKLELLLQ